MLDTEVEDNTQEECKGCKYSPEYNDGVYTLRCGNCERFYGSNYHNGYYLLDEYKGVNDGKSL